MILYEYDLEFMYSSKEQLNEVRAKRKARQKAARLDKAYKKNLANKKPEDVETKTQKTKEVDVYRLYVDSSNIRAIWFKERSMGIGVLYVEFNSGSVYEYHRFPASLHDKFLGAVSYGKFFWSHIRGKFPYRRLKLHEE